LEFRIITSSTDQNVRIAGAGNRSTCCASIALQIFMYEFKIENTSCLTLYNLVH